MHSTPKTLLICNSVHNGNTMKIAKVIAEILNADIKKTSEIQTNDTNNYTMIGFGSGIYSNRHHIMIYDFIDALPPQRGKKAFVFCTAGVPEKIFGEKYFNNYAKKCSAFLEEHLVSKGFTVLGAFSCPGLNTNSFLKYFGGLNKNRPGSEDFLKAKEFAKEIIQWIQ